jgi:DNA polymerase-3 subunit chi
VEVLLNLGGVVPPGFERFERLIEVVSAEDADLQQARLRWRHYASRGYAMTRHDRAEAR